MINRYRYPLRFYVLSTLIPWSLWGLAGYLSHLPGAEAYSTYIGLMGFIGLCGPLLVSALMIGKDKALIADVAGRFFKFKAGTGGYVVVSLVMMPASILLAMGVSVLFGYDINQFAIPGHATFTSAVFPVWFLLMMAPIIEEIAWHTYGTDCLRQKFSLFTTCMIFALYWGLWHVPLASINGYYHSNLVLEGALYSLNFLVSIFPLVFLMNWLYYKTGRNILVPVAVHLTANVFNEVFATHPDSKVIQTGLLLVLCGVVLYREREMFFGKLEASDAGESLKPARAGA
ncbi:MAG: CPBP family intramembrane glutamic endopeptidase [Reinekea sp.]|nr:CPBP family intramembrane glutamic endopeptidase [Reinekea sp.]